LFQTDEDRESEKVNLKVISHFPLQYWLIVASYSFYSMGVCLFDNVSSKYFQDRFGLDPDVAGIIIAIPSIIVIFLCPLFGSIIDYVGAKTVFSIFTS
jgi:nitrate/nitrite transporter NarK